MLKLIFKVSYLPFFLAMVFGCNDNETAFQLRFLPESSINTEDQLLSVVNNLEIMLDGKERFTGITQEGQTVGPWVAQHMDSDQDLELVMRKEISINSGLPLIRLYPGSNVQHPFRIIARGYDAHTLVAAVGGTSTLRFLTGEKLDLFVPINLRASYLPPRVLLTLPQNGTTDVPSALGQVYVEFSSEINEDFIKKANLLQIVYQGINGEIQVPGQWIFARKTVEELGIKETRTGATFLLETGCALSPGVYHIIAMSEIQDSSQRQLDQDSVQSGNNNFSSSFTIPGAVTDTPCTNQKGCKSDPECNQGEEKKFQCVLADEKSDTGLKICVPIEQCQLATQNDCPSGFICSNGITTTGTPTEFDILFCVPDCRERGTCGATAKCDLQTGRCLSCNKGEPCYEEEPCFSCVDICKEIPDQCAACQEKHQCPPTKGI